MNAEYRIDRASTYLHCGKCFPLGTNVVQKLNSVLFSNLKHIFSHWLINGENRGSSNPIVLVIDKPLLITAVYAQQQAQYTLTVTTIPETGLNISIGGTNYTSPKTVILNSGTSRAIEVTSPQERR